MILLLADPGLTEYAFFSIIGLVATFFLLRWVFLIEKRMKQNEQSIGLLKLIADKLGVPKEDIDNAKNTGKY